MQRIGPIKHPVKMVNNEVAEFNFDYFETEKGRYAVCYMGDLEGKSDVLFRIESACIFGHVFGVARCDCHYQLAQAMIKIAKEGTGMVVYAIDQDCRGLGIAKHFEVYVLRQKEHLETKEVYERLNEKPDVREYDDVVEILNIYKINGVRILTNNPRRLNWLEKSNIKYERIPLEITLNSNNSGCLMDEKKDLGYLFSFNTHEEWLQYMNKVIMGLNKSDKFIGCLITNDFKNIICESYNTPKICCETINKEISKIQDKNLELKAYIVGDFGEECEKIIIQNNIRQIYIPKEKSMIDTSKLIEQGINIEFI